MEAFEHRVVPTVGSVVSIEVISHATEGGSAAEILLTRTDTTNTATGTFSLSGGTASSGDYSEEFENLNFLFQPGQDTIVLTLTALPDSLVEETETVYITLTAVTGCTIGELGYDVVNIADDPPVVAVTATDTFEGSATGGFTFTRSGGDLSSPLTVTYTVDGTATSGTDYPTLSTVAEFAANQNTLDIPIVPVTDELDEPTEGDSLTFQLSSAYTVDPNSVATVNIFNNAPPDAWSGTGTGLRGWYYNYTDETHTAMNLVQTRVDNPIDNIINNDFGTNSPIPGVVSADHFQVMWVGQVQAKYTDNYTFFTRSDDGVRLWINGEKVIDNWTEHSATTNLSQPVPLQAGDMSNIWLEYNDYAGAAVIKLGWVGTVQPAEIIPRKQLYPQALPTALPGTGTGLTARYFNWDGTYYDLVKFKTDAQINNEWGNGAPFPEVQPDYFFVDWTGQVEAKYTDFYVFQAIADDTVQLYIDGQLVIDSTSANPTPGNISQPVQMFAGSKYDISMRYYEHNGNATAKLLWKGVIQPPEVIPQSQLHPEVAPTPVDGAGTGLKTTYFWPSGQNAKSKAGPDGNVEFEWQFASPEVGVIPDDLFSARWVGQVQPRYTGWYNFTTTSDDGVMLWVTDTAADADISIPVNYRRLIDNWTDHAPTENKSKSIFLEAEKKYPLVMQYYENSFAATAKLSWSSEYQTPEIIPITQLYPTIPTKRKTLVEPGGTLYPFGPEMEEFLIIRSSYPTSKASIFEGVPYWRKDDGNLLTLPSDVAASVKANGGWSGVIPPGSFFGPDGCGPSVGVALIPPEAGMDTYLLHFSGPDLVRDGFFKVGFVRHSEWLLGPNTVPEGYEAVICGGAAPGYFLGDVNTRRRLNDVVSFLKDYGVKITAYLPLPGFAVDENGWVYWTTNPAPSEGDSYER